MNGVRTVLFVCQANTARSVMAHVMLERMLAERAVASIRVRSGGIANYVRDGMLPSLDARLALREHGIHLDDGDMASTDLRSHRDIVAETDLILTMTADQRAVMAAFTEAAGKPIFTLREFAGEEGDIADPAMQGEDVFRHCRDEIRRCLTTALPRLLALLDGQAR